MNGPKAMDAIDKRILCIVQKDASLSIREIAAQVGVSQTACWKRLQRLDTSGVIKRRIRAAGSAEGRARINRVRFGPGG